jgi:H+/Na+-translocating ferredoxin:NAD+ oxidoreductase subunit B
MGQNIYRQVQNKIDQFSMGFPETESGVEIKILKKLFSENDAKVFMEISFLLEDSKKIAGKIGMSEDEANDKLTDMAKRGLLFSMRKAGKTYYSAIPFVHGLWEFQVKRMDKEFAELVKELFDEKMNVNMAENVSGFLRVVPVNQAVDSTLNIASYEDAAQILKSKDIIVVTDCVCRKRADLVDEYCGKPLEACFMFGSMAHYYIDHGLGRKIDLDEALKIVKECQDAGLVTQPASSLNPGGMCNCCGDCCGVLLSLDEHPKPAQAVFSNYYAQADQDECSGCAECIDRCQMDAIKMNDDTQAQINLDRCIGCGLCVTTCSTESISLKAKNEKDRRVPAKNGEAQMTNMAMNRGTTNQFLRHEVQAAYRHKNIFGVINLVGNMLYRTGRQVFRSLG